MAIIKVPSTGQIFQIEKQKFPNGQELLAEVDGITEPVFYCDKDCPQKEQEKETPKVKLLRVLSDEDKALKGTLKEKAGQFLTEAKEKVFRHGLDMKILDADLSFDEKKLTFYFSANGRVDFRSLVSDMVGSFNKIIRLQQVGPRDEAKLFGGYGKCGRELCCAKFISNLGNVNLEMTESQDIAGTKVSKLSGCCGKPMCCLLFEDEETKKVEEKT